MVVRLPSLLTAQIVGVAIGFSALAFAPPASGRMLLVPIGAGAADHVLPLALDHGALLMGAGPLPHSYVVRADRAAIAGAMMRAGVVTLAAPPAGCGETERPA